MSAPSFPTPIGGASLILSFRLERKTTLIIGGNPLAAFRAFSALEADSEVVVFSRGLPCNELQWRATHGQLLLRDLDALSTNLKDQGDDGFALDAYLATSNPVSLICVTDTLSSSADRRSRASAAQIYNTCRKHRIPVNITDYVEFCDFSFTSTHRFVHSTTGNVTPLQIGVTTNGQGCRLSARIRREIVSRLPREIGAATQNVGRLRSFAKSAPSPDEGYEEFTEETTPNQPVSQRPPLETAAESANRRMKWVVQVSEYWPLSRLAKMTDDDIENVLTGESAFDFSGGRTAMSGLHPGNSRITSIHDHIRSPPGRIFLVGSGPGHPSLLTIAAHNVLTKYANVILSDKLVPAAVLDLIPAGIDVQIARKFPGNAEGAQTELQEAAIKAAKRGLTVVRLKQGDPTVYGRAGEEILYFRSQGFEPVIIPGVTSALGGPIFAGIPVTQRGAAESFIVCTGVGKGGKEVKLPGYDRGRTLVILMGVARLPTVLEILQNPNLPLSKRGGPAYPAYMPIAIIERASMPDQRVICSTLRNVVDGLNSVGDQRPPGMIVVGWAVLCLWGKGDMKILDENAELDDEQRVKDWLENTQWRVEEGLGDEWRIGTP